MYLISYAPCIRMLLFVEFPCVVFHLSANINVNSSTNFQRESIMTTISEHVVCDIVIGGVVVVCKVHVK